MKASSFYRVAAALLVLFAAAHTVGFSQADPQWHVDALVASMRSVHFDAMGSSRSYWDFFMAAGLTGGLFYLFAAVLAWQLARLPREVLATMRLATWGFALCFAAIAVVSWMYLFVIPIVFAVATTFCLGMAAWLSGKPG